MRSLTPTRPQGLAAQLLPARPALARVASPHLVGLMGLYAPTAPVFGRAAAGGTELCDLENLAPHDYAGLPNARFWRRASTNSSLPQPETRADLVGPYWDFPAARRVRFVSAAGLMPWRPGDTGGHAPGTLMAVVRLTASTGGEQVVFCFSANSANIFSIGFGSGSAARGVIRTNTSVAVSTAGLTLNRPYVLLFTTRSNTDHQIIARDLWTGAVLSATSASNSGTAGTIPSFHQIGYQTGAGDLNFFSSGRVYLCAFWARGMSQAEMHEVARAPMSLLAPSITRRAFAEDAGPVEADLDAVVEDCELSATGTAPWNANLDATVEDCVLTSAAAQVGAGTLALFEATVEDCELESATSVQVSGDLSVVLEDCVLSALGVTGSLGPFTRRPFLVLN